MAEAALHTETTCKIRHVHIECPICLSRFTDPKILDCLHSFCLKCLQELIDKQDPKTDLIICPMCKKQTSIPDEGLSDLLSCFFLSSLIDDVINLEGSKEDINPPVSTCEGCDEGLEAVSRCVDCDANFCKTCLDHHAKLKVIRHHQIVDAVSASTERPKDKIKTEAQKCRKHTNQDLRFYCDTCELLACPVCAVFDHRASNHNLSEINDSIRSYRRAVDETLQKFKSVKKEDVKVYDRELRYIRQFRPSQNQVDGQSESLLRGIAVDKKDRIAVADCERKVISLHNMDGSIISTIHHGDISSDCYLAVSSKERLIFTDYDKKKLVCVDFMGNEVFNIITSIDGKPAYPYGVCCDDAGDIYVSVHYDDWGTDEIHHYGASGEHIGCVARGLGFPLGMTSTPTGDLIVADSHSVEIMHRL
ncbi:E3 ubiquitin-protein ligase TRIM56-like [Asterias amurensis]|uniref:E3 ubiquitin-protein ligase TRIM56-like n=1 Tax=Asterias amurensis TaxID=7602 RepID=UPI003AB855AC